MTAALLSAISGDQERACLICSTQITSHEFRREQRGKMEGGNQNLECGMNQDRLRGETVHKERGVEGGRKRDGESKAEDS